MVTHNITTYLWDILLNCYMNVIMLHMDSALSALFSPLLPSDFFFFFQNVPYVYVRCDWVNLLSLLFLSCGG